MEGIMLFILARASKVSAWLRLIPFNDYHKNWFLMFGKQLLQKGYTVEGRHFTRVERSSSIEPIVYAEGKTFLFWIKANILTADILAMENFIMRNVDIPNPQGIIVCESSIPENLHKLVKTAGVPIQLQQGVKGIKELVLAYPPADSEIPVTL